MSPGLAIYAPGTVIHASFPFGRHYAVVGEDAGEFLEVHPVTSREWPEEIYPSVRVDPSKYVPFSKPSFIQVISVRISKDIIDNDFGTLPEESWRKLQEVRE